MRNEELLLVLKQMEENAKYSKILQRWIYIKNKNHSDEFNDEPIVMFDKTTIL